MLIDNFESIKSLMRFKEGKDSFYFIQIMQRAKDGTDIKKNNRIITNYYITSLDYLDDRMEEIKTLCRIFHARSYISINPCSFKKSCIHAIGEISDIMLNESYRSIINLMPTLAGKYSDGGNEKLWIIDYDTKDLSYMDEVREAIKNANGKEGKGNDKVKAIIPTKNGYHIMTTPYNPQETEELFKRISKEIGQEISIHKNSPTLLYFDDSEYIGNK